jgi:5-methylcytosine-specific restriction enzyme A
MPNNSPFHHLYNSRSWRRAAKNFLNSPEGALCSSCKLKGKLERATEVDHIRSHNGDTKLFWDESNWQGLCKPCHSEKTRREQNIKLGKKSRIGACDVTGMPTHPDHPWNRGKIAQEEV